MRRIIVVIALICFAIGDSEDAGAQVQWVPSGGLYPNEDSHPSGFTVWNNKLYFTATDSIHNMELWSYDELGPASLVYDINPGYGIGMNLDNGAMMAGFNNKLYVSATADTAAPRLFAYDGASAPKVVYDMSGVTYKYPYSLTPFGTSLYFGAYRNDTVGGGCDLYRFDGAAKTSRYIIPGSIAGKPGCHPHYLTPFRDKLYFTGFLPSGNRVMYELDTATENTKIIMAGPLVGGALSIYDLTVVDTTLYFIADDGINGHEIWRYNGKSARRLTDLGPGKLRGAWDGFAYYRGEVYFGGCTDGINYQLFKLNNRDEAELVYTVNPLGNGVVSSLFVHNGILYFAGRTNDAGLELWRYDGTTCAMVTDLYPGAADGIKQVGEGILNKLDHAVYKNHVYFQGNDGIHHYELFRITDANGIRNMAWSAELAIHPNPAVSSVTIDITLKSAESLQVSLTDITGRQVFSSGLQSLPAGKNALNIPVQALAAGQYFYHLSNDRGQGLASGTLIRQ